jgi:hypothetical protein
MLREIQFSNYRCFREFTVPLKAETVVVGRNNAGKSTFIEGLRLIAIVTERYPNLNFQDVPDWLPIGRINRGARVDFSGLGLSWENIFYQYQAPPALVRGTFVTGETVTVHVGPDEESYVVVTGPLGRVVTNRIEARQYQLPQISVLPQVAPLEKKEEPLSPEYIRANLSSYLAPRHFRNQLRLFNWDHFDAFRHLVESSWPGVQIVELRGHGYSEDDPITLLVRDGDFVAEVAWMGHGLQMWLQTMWFITRTAGQAGVVLDEPDVYMHPDLQRRLIRLIRNRFPQVIFATHSTEILAETDATNVLIMDRNLQSASFSVSLPAVQRFVENIGSAQNLQLTRLWRSKRLLLVEGDDLRFLRIFQEKLFPESLFPLDAIPNVAIGGWSGWPYAVGSAMVLRNSVGEKIITYCILDSDYHTEAAIESRHESAVEKNVELHVWNRKEIENYLICPAAVSRVIKSRQAQGAMHPTSEEVVEAVIKIANELKFQTIDAMAQEYFNESRRAGLPNANQRARMRVEGAWNSFEGIISVVSGKEMVSRLSGWSQLTYGVSFGPVSVAREMRHDEIIDEIRAVLKALEDNLQLPK